MILPFSPYLPYRAHARRIGNLTEQRVVIHLQAFYIASNGVTVKCPGVAVGASFTLGGVTYTKRDRAGLVALKGTANEADLVTSCTTGVTDMSSMFFVRALHPACCCSSVAMSSSSVPHPLAPRSPLTPHGRPSLAVL